MRINGIANQNNQNFGKLIIHRDPATTEFLYNLLYRGKNGDATQDTFEKTIKLLDKVDKETGSIPVHFKADNSSLNSRCANFEFEANGYRCPSYGFLDYGRDDFPEKALDKLNDTYKYFTERFDVKKAEEELKNMDEDRIRTIFERYC